MQKETHLAHLAYINYWSETIKLEAEVRREREKAEEIEHVSKSIVVTNANHNDVESLRYLKS